MFTRFFSTISSLLHTKHTLPIAFLSIVFLIIIGTNFPFHSWLIGWDNVLPELNFPLNFLRSLSTTWVNNQGLGHVGGHGHAANLPHTLFLWLLSFVIPTEFLRPTATLLFFISGGFGAYVLTYFIQKKKSAAPLGGVLSALIYSFSLGTIQQFFTPLESFTLFHGLLPWVLLAIFRHLDAPRVSSRARVGFLILSWLFSGIGFLPPLFVVYGLMLGSIFGAFMLSHRTKAALQRILVLGGIILIANLYWLSSVAYFTATSSTDYLTSQNNQLSTDGYNWQSIAYGGALDVALVRGFLYWALDIHNSSQAPLYVMQPWYEHYQNPLVIGTTIIWFLLALAGVGVGIRSFKHDYRTTSLVIIFIVLLISLGQRIPLVANISYTLKELPIISQAFRAAFTKVSVPFVLMIAVLAGTTLTQFLMSMQHKMSKMISFIFSAVLVVTLGWGAPLFAGHLFSDQIKQTLPTEYSEVFAFFKQQPTTERIAVLPLIEHWGWHYYDWEYIGSGFLWYGIKQPILDRSFDSWSKNNETFYSQLYAASENQDEQSVLAVLQQYRVSWLFLDSHLTKSSGDRVQDEIDFLTALFVKNNFEAHSFGGITLYKNPLATNTAPNEPIAEASGVTTYTTQNSISRSLGSYISGSSYIFPFSQFTSTHGLELTSTTDSYEVPGSLKTVEKNKNYELRLPALNEKILASASVSLTDSEIGVVTTTKIPLIAVDQQVFDVNNSKINVFPLEELEPAEEYFLTVGNTVQTIRPSDSQKTEVLTSLDLSRNLPLQLFSTNSTQVANLSEAVKWASLSDCFAPESTGKKYGTPTGTTTVTAGDSACFSAKVGQLTVNEDLPELYSLTFKYKLDQGALEHLCLTRSEDKQKICYSGELANLEQTDQEKEAIVTFQLSQAGTYWLDFRVGAHTQFTIEDISLQNHERLFSAYIPAENWVALQNEQVIPLASSPTNLAILLPKEEKYSFGLGEIASIANCDVFNQGKIILEKNSKLLSITAKNGAVACLPITLADLDISNIIAVQGVQNSGKSPEFTVSDLSANKVTFEVSPVGTFTTGIGRVRSQTNRKTDQLTTTVRSYTDTSSISSLEAISVIPVPLEWFSQLHLATENPSALTIGQNITSSTNNWYAKTTVNTNTNTLIVLDQSSHPAWIAFPSNRPWQHLDHRTYNGWANAWIVPAGTTAVTMLFWPQLLSFAGYGVLVVTLGWLTVATLRQRTNPPAKPTSHELHRFVIRRFAKLRERLLGK